MNSVKPINYAPYAGSIFLAVLATGIYYVQAFINSGDEPQFHPLLLLGMAMLLAYAFILMAHTRTYVFDPLVFVAGTIFIGVILKVPYLVLNVEERDALLLGQDVSILEYGGALIATGIAAFLVGYLPFSGPGQRHVITYQRQWSYTTLWLLGGGILFVTATAAFLAVKEIGFLNVLENPSAKRFLDLEEVSSRLGTSLYLYFKIALLAKIAAYLSLVYLMFNRDRVRFLALFIFVFATLISIVIPFIFSARAAAALALIDFMAIAYFTGLRFKKIYILLLVFIGFAVFGLATFERLGEESSHGIFESILARRYLMDLTKTGHIAWFMDDAGLRFSGETLIGWLFAPVPDAIMANKPLFVDMGGWIGKNIYGWEKTGVPPGIIAELYMNFGWFGVIFGMLVIGVFIGLVWRWFLPRAQHPVILVFGAMFFVRFGIFLFNNDLGTFILKNLMETLPACLIVGMCVSVQRTRTTGTELG